MLKSTPDVSFEDARGTITDLVADENIYADPIAVTIVASKKGAIRGNHYHANTHQWAYVTSGVLRVTTGTQHVTAMPGDIVYNPPGEPHAWQALEDTVCVVITLGPRAGSNYESDTYRLEEPILA